MNRIQSVILVGILCSTLHAERISSDIQEHITKRVEQDYSTGISIAVVDGEGTSFFSAGPLVMGQDALINEDSLFEIGSITKVFTSLLMAEMAQKGEIALDDPVSGHLPSAAVVPSRGDEQITLRHLASHHSALPRMPGDFAPASDENPYVDYDGDDLITSLKRITLTRDIGGSYEYSNLGAGLLGFALAHRAGTTYENAVLDRICKPLGMKDTTITLNAGHNSRLARGHARGRVVSGWDIDALAGAGALRSTTRDMAKFIKAQLNPGATPLADVLNSVRKEKYETGIENLSIALGWHVWTKHDVTLFWHNGGTGGYKAFCGFRTDKNLGVVVLTNSRMSADDLGLHLLEPKFDLQVIRTTKPISSDLLDDYVGYYEIKEGDILHITREGDLLFAQRTNRGRYPIYPSSEKEFFYKVVDVTFTFERVDGKVDHIVSGGSAGPVKKAKKLGSDYKSDARTEVKVDARILAQYVGKYQFAPGLVLDVVLKGDQLHAQLTGQASYPIFPESQTRFFYKIVDAQVSFVVGDDKKAKELILHQGGFDQTAKRME